MKRKYFIYVLFILCINIYAQDTFEYHRSSMYSILLKHENKEFNNEITTIFKNIPIPDKFDDHNLSKRIFNAAILQKEEGNSIEQDQKEHIDQILGKNAIPRRLIAKWFNYSKDGLFDCDLLIKRGYYDASAFDIDLADRTIRGRNGVIEDVGKELIANTYIVIHDVEYYDKREKSSLLSGITDVAGAVATLVVPGASEVIDITTAAAFMTAEKFAGFKVFVTSYLYKLDWNEEIEGTFYNEYYTNKIDINKSSKFNRDKTLFTASYIGKETVYSGITSLKGVNGRDEFFKKVCTRAIDKAIAQLQKQYDEFRVKTPLLSTEPITAKIGIKEDVTEDSRFEVLEVSVENGKTAYKRVGVIKPIKGKIWDNRYLAEFEDENKGNNLTATEFEIIRGGDFYPGMLIREINN